MEVVLKALYGHAGGCIRGVLWAYIDPSTGSLLFQVAAASLISAGLFVKGWRARMTWLLTGGWRKGRAVNLSSELDDDFAVSVPMKSDELSRKAA